MKKLQEFVDEQKKDSSFVSAYESLEPNISIMRALIEARISKHMTQQDLADKTGIAQTEISKIESGTRNPSLKVLKRLAEGMDMVLQVSFVPKRKC